MSKRQDKLRSLRRLLWQLYADTNTRFNLMIDECAHLQQTIHSHLSHSEPTEFGFSDERDLAPTKQRVWIPRTRNPRDPGYYFRSPQERALRNLWMSMGALASGLEANQEEFRQCFKKAFLEYRAENEARTDALFWFLSLRGHYLNVVFPNHLALLQHAHEKLIQLLENMPGILPGPTLMRRWSSGGYGEFLSEYSRQVNWDTQDLFWNFCLGTDKPSEFEEWRQDRFLVHAWSHRPTSHTTINQLVQDRPNGQERLSFTTIWSSYFYLELPILFPLLYHECAHHYADRPKRTDGKPMDGSVEKRAKLWFDRPGEIAELLHRVAPFESDSKDFWKSFVSEIWADTISIACCGDGFLAALALQVIGLEGDYKTYSDFDLDTDTRLPLNRIGHPSRRIRSAQYPSLELSYFWEARIAIAIEVYKAMYRGRNNPWVEALEVLIEQWNTSGSVAMSPSMASMEHATYWEYRAKLNRWVADVVGDGLADFVEKLRRFRRDKQVRKEYALDAKIIGVLRQGLKNYTSTIFVEGLAPDLLFQSTRPQWRLEDICAHVRWSLSGSIDDELQGRETNDLFDKWAVVYANYLRAGDGVVFRLALEWILTLKDVVHTAAWLLRRPERERSEGIPELPRHEAETLEAIRIAVWRDFREGRMSDCEAEATKLAMLLFTQHRSKWPNLRAYLSLFSNRLIARLSEVVRGGVRAGTYTLGVVRPAYVAKSGSYSAALAGVKRHYDGTRHQRQALITGAGFSLLIEDGSFSPLFGEYNFATYQHGFTPVEKDIHPINPPPSILKPRAVLQVSRRTNHPQCALSFVRVSQVDFRYRWQWVVLAEQLQDNADIFLSSAWEDIILVTYHENLQDYEYFVSEYGLGLRRWQDVHSNIGLSEIGEPCLTTKAPDEKFAHVVEGINSSTRHVASYRTGRYDVYIEWEKPSPRLLVGTLDELPVAFWEKLESMVTSLLTHPKRKSEKCPGHTLVSQLILRHEKLDGIGTSPRSHLG